MIMKSSDAISAKEGVVFVTVDGKTFEFAELINLEARVDLAVADIKAIGKRMVGAKITGSEGTGSVTYHYHRPEIRKVITDYLKTGKYPDITIKATNADMTSKAGRHSILLKGVIFTGANIFLVDGDSDDTLQDESDIRFEDIDVLETFKSL